MAPRGHSPANSPQKSPPPSPLYARKQQTRLQRILSYPGVRALLLCLLSFAAIIQFGRTHFYRDPGSIFFDESRAYEKHYSAQRLEEALTFIERSQASAMSTDRKDKRGAVKPSDWIHAGPNPQMCASFITIPRQADKQYIDVSPLQALLIFGQKSRPAHEQYPQTSIGSMLASLTPIERSDLEVKVLFATRNESRHQTWNEPWVKYLVDQAYTYRDVLSSEELSRISGLEALKFDEHKGILDYTLAMQHCYETSSAPYIAVFEDDIILAEGWFARTLLALRDIEAKLTRREETVPWQDLRLFSQERWTGWHDTTLGAHNEHWIALGLAAAVLGALLLVRRSTHGARKHLDNWTLAVVCLVAIPGLVVLFFQAGKASVVPQTRSVHRAMIGGGSHAMVLPRERVPALVQYMRQREVGHYDRIMRDYAKKNKLARYAIHPVQVQHVGPVSVHQQTGAKMEPIWSMAFESLRPARLAKQHRRMVSKLYGDRDRASAQDVKTMAIVKSQG